MKLMLAFFEPFINMSGGIEHVLCNFANAMTERGHQVSAVYCYGENGRPTYPLSDEVKLYNVMTAIPQAWNHKNLNQTVRGMDKVIREAIRVFSRAKARDWNEKCKGKLIGPSIKKILKEENPDIIVSFRPETSNYLLNTVGTSIPVITMFHIDPLIILPDMPACERQAIEKSKLTQVLLKRDIAPVERYCPKAKVIVVPNAVPQYTEQADLTKEKSVYTIINVGRLNKEQKQQHVLIEAFAKLADDFPQWNVELWGGSDRFADSYKKELEALIQKYHLEQRVFLKGETREIEKVYMKVDIFAFPSAYEGFPLAMTEAMSAGLPVVAFKSDEAVLELVTHGKDGLLAEDGPDNMAKELKKLMESRELRIKLGEAGRESMKRFSPETIWDRWEQILKKSING